MHHASLFLSQRQNSSKDATSHSRAPSLLFGTRSFGTYCCAFSFWGWLLSLLRPSISFLFHSLKGFPLHPLHIYRLVAAVEALLELGDYFATYRQFEVYGILSPSMQNYRLPGFICVPFRLGFLGRMCRDIQIQVATIILQTQKPVKTIL